MRVVRQNLALSGGILLILVPLAALGVLGLAAVVLAHELAEVLVIANGVRAGRPSAFTPPQPALQDRPEAVQQGREQPGARSGERPAATAQ